MPVPSRRKVGGDAKVTTLSLDFSNVQDGGGAAIRVQEGDYILKLKEATVVPVRKDPSKKQIKWVFTIVKGPQVKQGSIYHNSSIEEDRLWTTRQVLAALLDREIPKKAINIDLAKYFGKEVGATLVDGEPYNGKIKSEISDFFPASQYDDTGLTGASANDDSDDDADEAVGDDAVGDDEDEEEIDIEDEDL